MKYLLIKLYSIIPKKIKNRIGKISWLSFFRDYFLKQNGTYREVSAWIERPYHAYNVKFKFYGSVKDVSKATTRGIENKLLLSSITLIERINNKSKHIIGFDIGANFGYLSLVWSQTLCKNEGVIYAFEPNADVFKSLKQSIHENNLNKQLIAQHCAVGSENRKVNLFVDGTTSNLNAVSETLKKENIVNTMINMVTLDSFIDNNQIEGCDFIKIDVDGIELEILNGSIDTLKKFKPIFIIETNQDMRIVEFFNQNNYKVLDMDLKPYIPNTELPLNIFCTPN